MTLDVVRVAAGERDATVTLLMHNGSDTPFRYMADVTPDRPIIVVSSRRRVGWRDSHWTGCDTGIGIFALAPGADLVIEHRTSYEALRQGLRLGILRATERSRAVWSPRVPLPR